MAKAISAAEKRAAVVRKYEEILGRNKYSQPRRGYAFKKYSDGRYYSDCSSSVALSYREAGYPFAYNGNSCPNTVGMYLTDELRDVPAVIKNGIIQNPEILQPGDLLLFAGKDSSRSYAGYVGHVEMVAKVDGKIVTIYGHGSGTPRRTEMNAYCRSRYSKKTGTKLGHRGLIRVRRFIWDGDGGVSLTRGMEGEEVKKLQQNLLQLGYALPEYGADGDFGTETAEALKRFQKAAGLPETGVYDAQTDEAMQKALDENDNEPGAASFHEVKIRPGAWNVRKGPGANYPSAGVVRGDSVLERVDVGKWLPVKFNGEVCFIGPGAVERLEIELER